ncbi:MAG: glycoside hydrolase family 31 protein, partial [Anaerolineales bacterium]|nr:glycoside hydrolase family 31 protein [Anaerolineales bacterium]
DWDNLRYHLGPGTAVSNLYPREHARAVYEGLQGEGETEILTLNRSAWAGSQRFATAVWSGDVDSTFEALANQVAAGLNIGLSGIPWWTTDIGGFHNGDPRTPYFQELIVRWFQYGLFCPLFRLHGFRDPKEGDWWDGAWDGDFRTISGGPNEVWSFGETAYAIIKDLLFLRERLRPYLHQQMQIASETGLPPMRPLFVDFPADETSWTVEDQFMLGADLLVAPVVAQGVTERRVYLPVGARWVDPWRETVHDGGQWLVVPAPLAQIPYFVREHTAVFANHPQAM